MAPSEIKNRHIPSFTCQYYKKIMLNNIVLIYLIKIPFGSFLPQFNNNYFALEIDLKKKIEFVHSLITFL